MECAVNNTTLIHAENESSEKIWYNRNPDDIDAQSRDPKLKRQVKRLMRQTEKKYGLKNRIVTDFGWGMMNGNLSALRWVLGDDWDMLDT